MQGVLKFFIFSTLSFLLVNLISPAFAQTTTTYEYDGQGRLVSAANDSGNTTIFEFDDANNLTKAKSNNGGAGNSPPTCTDVFEAVFVNSGTFNGIEGCSDSDGGTLTIISATNPPTGANVSVNPNNNTISFSNMSCNVHSSTRTVSDGQGGTTTSAFEVVNLCGGF